MFYPVKPERNGRDTAIVQLPFTGQSGSKVKRSLKNQKKFPCGILKILPTCRTVVQSRKNNRSTPTSTRIIHAVRPEITLTRQSDHLPWYFGYFLQSR